MNASNHTAVRVVSAVGGIAVFAAVCGAASLVSQTFGVMAGAAVVLAVFAACWLVHRVRPMLHPGSRRPREPQMTPPVTLADSQEPAQLAA